MEEGGSVRYANSGGKKRDYYKMLARTGRLETTGTGAKVKEHVPGWSVGDPDPAWFGGSSRSSSAAPPADPPAADNRGKGKGKMTWRQRRDQKDWDEL